MRKFQTILLSVTLTLLCYTAEGQYYTWLKSFPGLGYTGAEGISVDPDDNVLIAGNFENGITIEGSTYSGRGSFLLKVTENGTPLWHKLIRYSADNFWALSHVGTDGQGNSYIAGQIPQSVTIDGVTVSGDPGFNSMVAKFNSSGVLQWLKVIRNVQYFFDVKVNFHGDILLYTHHFTTVTIDNTTLNVGPNSFGALLNSDGDLQWMKTIGDPQRFSTWPSNCALDDSGNAYFFGIFNGSFSLDGQVAVSNSGRYDMFVTHVNNQGICEWITTAERKAPANYEPPFGLVIHQAALETDNLGNVYLGGIYWLGLQIGSFTLPGAHGFLIKLDPNGQPVWAKATSQSTSATVIEDIVSHNEKVYVSGITPGNYYFSMFTPAGDVIQDPIVIPLSADIATSIAVDSKDSVYVSGRKRINNTQGFAFKYNPNAPLPPPPPPPPPPSPGIAGIISGQAIFCATENQLSFYTREIIGATSYEWVITRGSNDQTISTSENELQLTLSDFQITGSFTVKVRGVNAQGAGGFSSAFNVVAKEPLTAPTLLATCRAIYFEESVAPVQWYVDDVLAPHYQSQKSISPDKEGVYFVTVSNACGAVQSNQIVFSPTTIESIFIPNIISPNDDGLNEKFIVDAKLESPELVIYNRWGNTVFHSKKYSNNWDGGGYPAGVYYYKVNSGCIPESIRGLLTITR